MPTRLSSSLAARFGARLRPDVALAGLTTFRVGGPADWLVEAHDAEQVREALSVAHEASLPVTLLGGGSNVLVGDRGIRGVVLRVRGGRIERRDRGEVRAEAGVTINGLVRWTIVRGLGGLERWAGTPGTVGGGLYNNAHFRERLIGDLVGTVGVADRRGVVREGPAAMLRFAYDFSQLQESGEVLLWATFAVQPADPGWLREQARESLAYRRRTQPLQSPSAGCIFRNPDPGRERLPPGCPASAGALIDRAGLKGRAIGGARVSPTHGNFIVNEGGATAREIRALIDLCKQTVADRFGVVLREEIVYLGEF